MVVYDRSYARWDGDRTGGGPVAAVIMEAGIRRAGARLFKRKFIAVLLVMYAFGAFLVWLGMLYARYYVLMNAEELAGQIPGDAITFFRDGELTSIIAVTGGNLFTFLVSFQLPVVAILLVMVGAGLVAEDRRTNALELYLSRPLGVGQYLVGKVGIMAFFVALVTLVPALVLVLADAILSLDPVVDWAGSARLGARALGAGAIVVLVPSLLVVAVSSLTRRGRNAAIALLGLLFLLEVVIAQGLQEIFRQPGFLLFSPVYNLRQAVAWMLSATDAIDSDVPVWQSFAVLGGLALISLSITLRRVRPVEVVA